MDFKKQEKKIFFERPEELCEFLELADLISENQIYFKVSKEMKDIFFIEFDYLKNYLKR